MGIWGEVFQGKVAARHHLARWPFVLGLGLLTPFAFSRWHSAHDQTAQLSLQLASQRAAAQTVSTPASPDFAQSLPTQASDPFDLLHQLRGECAEAHVQLQQFVRAPSPAATGGEIQLQQQDFAVSLKGSYPAIQQVLRALASRDPKRQVLTVQELHLRAARSGPPAAANEVEAQVVLRSWARPPAAAASAAERR